MMRRKWAWVLAAVLCVPALTVVWLSARLMEQDRALEVQRSAERNEQRAASAVQALILILADPSLLERDPGQGALLARLPSAGLLYRSGHEPVREASTELFQTGEQMEFRATDPAAAIVWYRRLAVSPNPDIRAGALMRLGRTLKNMGRTREALAVYDQLASLELALVSGWPAPIAAVWSRCQILQGSARREEAMRLWGLILAGKFPLNRETYVAFADDAAKWSGQPRPVELEALTDVVLRVEGDVRAGSRASSGRALIESSSTWYTVVWERRGASLHVLAASPAFVAREWLGRVGPGVWLQTQTGQIIGPAVSSKAAAKYPAESHLPWTVLAVAPHSNGDFSARRRMLLLLLGAVGVFTLTGVLLALRSMRRELALARMQEDFVAAVSHEFRTPLTSLRQISEALEDGRVATEERRQSYYHSLSRATLRLHRLVEDLLDFRRMQSGAPEYRRERVEVGEFTAQVLDGFRAEVSELGFEVASSDAPEGAFRGDREALGRALWNLLDNAVKYSGDSRLVEVAVECGGGEARWAVRDFGAGVPTAERELVFHQFYRGEEARRAGIRGTGIGLAMVSQIVQAHGGRVALANAPGAGSVFSISIPLEAD